MSSNTGNDGVVNPAGGAIAGIAPLLFAAGVPVTNYIATSGGLFEKVLNGFIGASTFIGTAGQTTTVPIDRVIPALSAVYIFGVYALGGATSAGAIAASSSAGRDNKEPRAQVSSLRGLPLRAHSAHAHLMEVFPAYALAAALTVTFAPTDRTLINLLGLHVIAKLAIFWPAYLLDIDAARTFGHLLATSSVVSVAWKLTFA